MHPLQRLAEEGGLLCPETRTPVRVRDGCIVSESGRNFGPVAGPLNLLRDWQQTLDAERISAGDIERVRTHLELADGPEVRELIRTALAATGVRLARDHLSAEARMLAERFRMPEFDFAAAVGPAPAASARPFLGALRSALRISEKPALEHIANSIGERLTAGREEFRSVRVRNCGESALRIDAIEVLTRWCGADGRVVAGSEMRTPLAADIEPLREITLQLRIKAPAERGSYRLEAALATPGRGAAGPAFLGQPVEVILCELPVFEYEYFPQALDYESDHRVAIEQLSAFVQARHAEKPARILEIGGGVHPTGQALAWHGHQVVSCDVSYAQCILGHLHFRGKHPHLDERLAFLSCDATELPFADGAFDGVALFAAFHHFAEPMRLLLEIKRVVGRTGFLFIGCDNCVPNPEDPTYREELARGINEQVWTLAEYAGFFREASLEVVRARVDCNSMKIVAIDREGRAAA